MKTLEKLQIFLFRNASLIMTFDIQGTNICENTHTF